MLFTLFILKSPYWLYVYSKKEKVKEVLTKYHGNSNPNSTWVVLQLYKYKELLNMDGADKR